MWVLIDVNEIPKLAFLDTGWGGDIALLRRYLPDTFINVRLSPVELAKWTPDKVRDTVRALVGQSGNLSLTGICCINMDDTVPDENVSALFEAREELLRLKA